jgi:hypothetical protein
VHSTLKFPAKGTLDLIPVAPDGGCTDTVEVMVPIGDTVAVEKENPVIRFLSLIV